MNNFNFQKEDDEKEDELIIVPLGSGCEVGRSCILMKFKGKKIMFDCGLHQGKKGYDSLPFFDQFSQDIQDLDLILITHFHTDHCAALPYLLKKTNFLKGKGKIYMTSPTQAIFKPFTQDSLKYSSSNLYKKEDISLAMRYIDVINFNQEFEYNGIKFKCYCAGHVLGAAMFQVEIDGIKILYTGDYSTEKERLMQPAQIPNEHIDVLIVESTFGTDKHIPRKEREEKFKEQILDVVKPKQDGKQGKVLMPVTSSGRAEEMLLILEELWNERPDIQDVPILFQSQKFEKFKEIFQIYLELTPKEIRNKTVNPFKYDYVQPVDKDNQYDFTIKNKPCVVLASSGQMDEGSISRKIFHQFCEDKDNLCLMTGFSQEGSFAKRIQNDQTESLIYDGKKQDCNLKCVVLPFCAHADVEQTREFVDNIKPDYIVLVHGQEKKAKDLQQELLKQFKGIVKKVLVPRNLEQEKFYFRKRQNCKIIGSLQEQLQTKIEDFNVKAKEYIEQEKLQKEKMQIENQNENEQIQDEKITDNNLNQDNQDDNNNSNNDNLKNEVIQQKIQIEGVLYQNEDKQMFLMNPNDKNTEFPIQKVSVQEKLILQYTGDMDILTFFAKQIVNPECQLIVNKQGKQVVQVKDNFYIEKIDNNSIAIKWVSGIQADELAENFSLLIIQLQNQKVTMQDLQKEDQQSQHIFKMLQNEFPLSRIDVGTNLLIISSQEQQDIATINLRTKDIVTNNEIVRKRVQGILQLVEEYQK